MVFEDYYLKKHLYLYQEKIRKHQGTQKTLLTSVTYKGTKFLTIFKKLNYPMRFILSSLILLSILSCGKESPAVTDPVISYTLTVSSGTGGSVSSPGGSYNQGQSVSITATPNPNTYFVNWSNGSTDNPLILTVNSNQTVTANFEKRKYPLTVSITGSGTVSEEIISAGKTTTEYTSGSVIRLTANPSDEWVIFMLGLVLFLLLKIQ